MKKLAFLFAVLTFTISLVCGLFFPLDGVAQPNNTVVDGMNMPSRVPVRGVSVSGLGDDSIWQKLKNE